MGLFSGRRAADQPAQRSFTLPFEVSALSSGAVITDYATVDANGESALRSVAVGAAVSLICSLASEMPVSVYRGYGSDRVELRTPDYLQDPGATGHGLEDWLHQLVQTWLYRGNAYGEVMSKDTRGRARQVMWFHPDTVHATVVDGRAQWWVNGRPWDRPEDFVHQRVNPVAGRVLGLSVIEQHALQIGVSLAASKFGQQWFADGAHPSALLVNQSDIDQAQATTVKQRWQSLFNGTREPAVLGKGWDYKPIQINPAESQFLETQRFTEAQCARMFGPAVAETLGYETGGSMTYANVVDRRSDLLTFTLNRWLTRAERLLTMLLPEPQYAKFNRDALLQSTTLARYQAHSLALADGWRTVDEVREIEDLPPLEDDTPDQLAPPDGTDDDTTPQEGITA